MSDTCPTCGAEVRIVGETTKHYEAEWSMDALNTQAQAVSRLRERVEELEGALEEIRRETDPDRIRTTGREPQVDRVWHRARQALQEADDGR